MRILVYWTCLLALVAYALLRGGRPEKAAALVLLAGSAMTWVMASPLGLRFTGVETGVLLVDLAVLAGFTAIALRSDRTWPLWLTALQLIGTLAHAARLADLALPPVAYGIVMAMWSYPMMLTIALGVRGRQRMVKMVSADSSSPSSSQR
jgi:hypothetical protein